MNILIVSTVIYCCLSSSDKCTYCESLWIKVSAKGPKCKCKSKELNSLLKVQSDLEGDAPVCSQWGHRRSCCWSTRWPSTWCPPGRTPPAEPQRGEEQVSVSQQDGGEVGGSREEENHGEVPALPSGSARWRSAAASRSQSWCRTAQSRFSIEKTSEDKSGLTMMY